MEIELSSLAHEWQAIARSYADEFLLPYEIDAEFNDGELATT